MLIYVNDANGVVYPACAATPNLIRDIPVGTHITGIYVDGNIERGDLISDGDDLVISLAAIRRIRGSKKRAA